MMNKPKSYPIVECVLNISEGRDKKVLKEISDICAITESSELLHMDSGYDTNRTVLTLVAKLDPMFSLLVRIIEYAIEHLDIHRHQGFHPRIGILDVIPFIPLSNITSAQLREEVKSFSQHIGQKYGLPIFYYGSLSPSGKRALHDLRGKGLLGLKESIGNAIMSDAGPQMPHDRLGASCITVRDFMLAYNINLDTNDLMIAKKIAHDLIALRESLTQRSSLDIRDVKFLGWSTPEYGCCQISTNIYDIEKVTMTELYQLVSEIAAIYDIAVTGSELIGLSPMNGITRDTSKLTEAAEMLGLDSVRAFDINTHVLEHRLSRLSLTDSTT